MTPQKPKREELKQIGKEVVPFILSGNSEKAVQHVFERCQEHVTGSGAIRGNFDAFTALSRGIQSVRHTTFDDDNQCRKIFLFLNKILPDIDSHLKKAQIENVPSAKTDLIMHVARLSLNLGNRCDDNNIQKDLYYLAYINAHQAWDLLKDNQGAMNTFKSKAILSSYAQIALEANRCLLGITTRTDNKNLLKEAWEIHDRTFILFSFNKPKKGFNNFPWCDRNVYTELRTSKQNNSQIKDLFSPSNQVKPFTVSMQPTLDKFHSDVGRHIQSYLTLAKEKLHLLRVSQKYGLMSFEDTFLEQSKLQKEIQGYIHKLCNQPLELYNKSSYNYKKPGNFLDYFDKNRFLNSPVMLCVLASSHGSGSYRITISEIMAEILDAMASWYKISGNIPWAMRAYQLCSDYHKDSLCDEDETLIEDQMEDLNHLNRTDTEILRAKLQATFDVPAAMWRLATAERICTRFVRSGRKMTTLSPQAIGKAHREMIFIKIVEDKVAYQAELFEECKGFLEIAENHKKYSIGRTDGATQEIYRLNRKLKNRKSTNTIFPKLKVPKRLSGTELNIFFSRLRALVSYLYEGEDQQQKLADVEGYLNDSINSLAELFALVDRVLGRNSVAVRPIADCSTTDAAIDSVIRVLKWSSSFLGQYDTLAQSMWSAARKASKANDPRWIKWAKEALKQSETVGLSIIAASSAIMLAKRPNADVQYWRLARRNINEWLSLVPPGTDREDKEEDWWPDLQRSALMLAASQDTREIAFDLSEVLRSRIILDFLGLFGFFTYQGHTLAGTLLDGVQEASEDNEDIDKAYEEGIQIIDQSVEKAANQKAENTPLRRTTLPYQKLFSAHSNFFRPAMELQEIKQVLGVNRPPRLTEGNPQVCFVNFISDPCKEGLIYAITVDEEFKIEFGPIAKIATLNSRKVLLGRQARMIHEKIRKTMDGNIEPQDRTQGKSDVIKILENDEEYVKLQNDFDNTLDDLGKIFVTGIQKLLGNLNEKLIYFIPNEETNGIPFHALRASPETKRLIELASVAYSPSVSLLAYITSDRAQSTNNTSSRLRVGYAEDMDVRTQTNYGGEWIDWLKSHEQFDTWKSNNPKPKLSWLHICGHGEFDGNENTTAFEEARIKLDDNSDLLPRDLVGWDIETAILGCCSAGRAAVKRSDFYGFSSALMGSGTRTCIMADMPIYNVILDLFPKRFYENIMNEKMPKYLAYREAMQHLISESDNKRWSRPYFWSPLHFWGLWN